MSRSKLTKTQRRIIVHVFRDFATTNLQTTLASKHIDFANTIINGNRQNAPILLKHLQQLMTDLPTSFNSESVSNMIRRAVGKGSTVDGTSPELIGYFNNWTHIPSHLHHATNNIQAIARRSNYEDVKQVVSSPKQSGVLAAIQASTTAPVSKLPPKKVKKVPVVKVPTTALEIIQDAITNTTFTATELLTKKFTIIEFLDRIKLEVKPK